jgi:class 3 adenylate cyclase
MIAGYAGTKARATYTCIGDTVNLAARIEAHTKIAGRAILMDKATRDGLHDRIATEPLGAATFKGIACPMEIFAADARRA